MKEIFEEIKSLGEVSEVEVNDFTIEIYAKIDFYTKEDICITFDDFDINDCREKQLIVDTVDFILSNIRLIREDILTSITQYISQKYHEKITIEAFENLDIELYSIRFSPDDFFGNCCFGFHSKFEIEHGLGIVFERWKVKDIGWADICLYGTN